MWKNSDLKTSEYGQFLRSVLLWYFATFLIHQDMKSLKTSTKNKCQFIEPLVLNEAFTLLRKKCRYSELFWSVFFPYPVQMRENAGKMRTRITPNTDSFYAVLLNKIWWVLLKNLLLRKICLSWLETKSNECFQRIFFFAKFQ